MAVTKIAIKAGSIITADLFVKSLIVLPDDAIIAFHLAQGILYVRDAYTDIAVSFLADVGIRTEILCRLDKAAPGI